MVMVDETAALWASSCWCSIYIKLIHLNHLNHLIHDSPGRWRVSHTVVTSECGLAAGFDGVLWAWGDLSPSAVPLMRVHFNSPTEMMITEPKEIILVPNANKSVSSSDQRQLYPLCLALVLGRESKRGQLGDFHLNDNTVIEFGHMYSTLNTS